MKLNSLCILLTAAGITLGGCAAEINARGNLPPDDKVAQVTPGLNREQVMQILGSPSTLATFTDQAWYYIGQRTEDYAFYRPKVIERQVLVVRFDEDGLVSEVRHLNKDDGKPVEMVDRTTPTVGRELSLMQQIFGNLGKGPPIPTTSNPGQTGLPTP